MLLYCTAESDDQNSVSAPEKPPEYTDTPRYTEVPTRQADPNKGETDFLKYYWCEL